MQVQILQIPFGLGDIAEAARQLWQAVNNQHVIAFAGDMGAGKTTLIRTLCNEIGVTDTVSSPTFALINEYRFADENSQQQIIYHMDWYRLRDTAEAINAGVEDTLLRAKDSGAWCFVEWPEKAMELLQKPYAWVTIAATGADTRNMIVSVENE